MKTTKIAVAAMTVFCAASLVSSCVKAGKEKEPAAQPETEFTVSLNTVEADYAEVVVRHTGAKDVTWFGFVTDDVTTSEQDLINAQVAHLDKKSLHVGNAQTVAVRNLSETSNYRYIAFAVKDGKEVFGKPGSVSFSTSPNLKVTFTAEATEVKCNEASFTIGHSGNEAFTYTCFVTTDSATSAAQLAQSDFASNVTEGKLNEGVVLLSGNSQTVTFDELDDETSYRLIVYGIFDNNGTYIYYGTPADCAFSTLAAPASEAYNAWLGTWYIPTVVYQYDSNDEYIGDEVKPLPIDIKIDKTNKSYLISGIGPNNDKYDVPAEFVDGKLVAHPQVVYTWTHSQAGEIKEIFAGLYGEGEGAMWTWDDSLTLFTATIGSDGKATLTPGQSSDGIAFNGFQFIQYYSGGAYGYGGEYTLPNTMSRTQTASSVPASFHAGKLCAKTASPVKMQKGAVKFFVK